MANDKTSSRPEQKTNLSEIQGVFFNWRVSWFPVQIPNGKKTRDEGKIKQSRYVERYDH